MDSHKHWVQLNNGNVQFKCMFVGSIILAVSKLFSFEVKLKVVNFDLISN